MKTCTPNWKRDLLSPLILILGCTFSFAQSPASTCGLIVNAGPDKLVCEDSPVTILEGTVAGSGLRGYEWSPADGLSSPNVLRPSVTVTGRKCYVLTGKKKGTTNLVVNGSFEAGPTGFTTDYTPGTMSCYGAGFIDCEGTYGVLTNPQLGHTGFSSCGDHTSGSGNMMVLNGAPGFVNVWCQNIAVNPNRDYCISAWACSVHPSSPAQLEFTVNGAPLGSIGLSGSTCLWEQLTSTWNSGGSANARICILNRNTATGGNDFAIDDISMIEVCEQSDTVCVDIVRIDAFIQPPPKICCDNPIVQLNGTGSSFGPEYTYCWIATNGGRIVSGETTLMPFVDRAGTYTLIVKGPEGCTKEYEVEIEGRTTPPNAYAEVRDSLDCDNPEVRIFGGAFPDDNITYDWIGPGGFRSSEQAPWVSQPGIYTLTVTNDCGCIGMVSVTVYENDNILKVDIRGDSLTCTDPEGLLIAVSNRPGVTFEWNGPGGFSSDMDSIMVRDTGWYVVMVSNADGCENLDSFRLTADLLPPDMSIEPDTITCSEPIAGLSLLTKAQDHQWIFMDSIISSDSVLNTGIPGTYIITATGINGCSDSIEYVLEADTMMARFQITGSNILCDSTSSELCFDTLTDQNAKYVWTNNSGTTFEQNCLNVTEEGWVYLNSFARNGCDEVDSFFVDKLDRRPIPDISDTLIDCHLPQVTLWHGIDSSDATWYLPDGTTTTEDSIEADRSGIYIFEVQASGYECPLRDSVRVLEDFSRPSADLDSDSLTCTRDSVMIEHSTLDSISGWQWTGPSGFSSSLPSPWVKNPGIYYAIIQAPNGCTDSIDVVVPQSSNYPNIRLFGDTITCSDRQVQVYARADRQDLIFEWLLPSGGTVTDSSFVTGNAGEYRLTVTSPDSCIVERAITIAVDTLPPDLTLTGEDTIDCNRTEINLEVKSSSNIDIIWSGPGGFSSNDGLITIDESGTYTVQAISSNGCISTTSRTVATDTSKPQVNILGDTITCRKEQVGLIASIQSAVDLEWRGPTGSISSGDTLWTRMGGTFELTAEGANGCITTIDYTVEVDTVKPSGIVSGDTITCRSPEVWISAISTADSVIWEMMGGQILSDSVMVSTPGDYFVRMIGKNGCSSSDVVNVPIDTVAPRLSTGNDTLTCLKDSITLRSQVSLATSFWWLTSVGDTISRGIDPLVNSGGDYICVAINDRNGCKTSDRANVADLRDLPNAEIDVEQPDCTSEQGGVAVVRIDGGQAPYLVSLNGSTPGPDRNFPGLDPGPQYLRIVDALGCVSRDTVEIRKITIAQSQLISEVKIKLGDSIQLMLDIIPDPGVVDEVLWSPDISISCIDCLDPTVSPESNQRYYVEVTDTNGCRQFFEILVKVDLPQIFVPNVFTPDGDGINDLFFPYSSIPEEVTIEQMQIYTRWGELIFVNEGFNPNDRSFGWDGTFHDEELNPGVYVYVIHARIGDGETSVLSGDVTIIR